MRLNRCPNARPRVSPVGPLIDEDLTARERRPMVLRPVDVDLYPVCLLVEDIYGEEELRKPLPVS